MRKCAALAGVLLVLCGFVLCACTGEDKGSRTEQASATETADVSADETTAGEWLDECAEDARDVAKLLDRDTAVGTALAAFAEDADLAAIMQSDAYAAEIARLVEKQTDCDAESICVYAFCEEQVLFLYDSHFGEKEDYFTSYSLRKETWEESGFARDKETLLSGEDFGYSSLVGAGKVRYTVLSHWFTSEDGTEFYVAVTKVR